MRIRTGRGTAFAALVAGFALLASLPAPCPCVPEPPADAHSCCAPPAGYQVAESGCCEVPEMAPQAPAALSPPAALGLPGVFDVPRLADAARTDSPSPVSIDPPFSPPPLTVRRL